MSPPPSAPLLDPVLAELVGAATEASLDAARSQVLRDCAVPVIESTLRRRGSFQRIAREDQEDVRSAALERVVRALQSLRESGGAAVISRFEGYVASCARMAWLDFQRARAPERVRLLHQLRFLFEGRTGDLRFTWREDATGEGLAALAGQQSDASAEILARLRSDPAGTIQHWHGAQADLSAMPLPALVARVLEAAGGAIPLEALLDAVAAARGLGDGASAGDWAREPVDGQFNPREQAEWRDHLRWLWQALGQISLRQRTAFLLHAPVTADLEAEGIASLRQLAASLGIAADEFARLWRELPLEDRAIALRLGLERQQVINLRRVARDSLGKAWRAWKAATG